MVCLYDKNKKCLSKYQYMESAVILGKLQLFFYYTTVDIPATISTEPHKLLVKIKKQGKMLVLVKDRP